MGVTVKPTDSAEGASYCKHEWRDMRSDTDPYRDDECRWCGIAKAEAGSEEHTPEDAAKLVERLRVPEKHNVCEDCWYSCPKSGDCCNEIAKDDPCNCGADRRNKERTEAADLIESLQELAAAKREADGLRATVAGLRRGVPCREFCHHPDKCAAPRGRPGALTWLAALMQRSKRVLRKRLDVECFGQ